MKKILYGFIAILTVTALPTFAQTWSAPSGSPPSYNTYAPINVSSVNQIKTGGLSVNVLNVSGNSIFSSKVGIGAISNISYPLDVIGDIRGSGYIRGITGLCIGSNCITSWPSSGGTMTSLYQGTGMAFSTSPITTSGTISLNTTGISSCTNSTTNKIYWNGSYLTCGTDQGGTGTVTSVATGYGLSGGPITSSGTLSVDTSYVQKRLQSSCSYGQAIQAVDANGNITCTSTGASSQWTTTGSNIYYPSGYVGIGTTPSYNLDVNGNAHVYGNLYVGTSGIIHLMDPGANIAGIQDDARDLNFALGGNGQNFSTFNIYNIVGGQSYGSGLNLNVFGGVSANTFCFKGISVACITASNADLTLNSAYNNSLFLGNSTNGIKINQNGTNPYVKLFSNGTWWNQNNSSGTLYFSNGSGQTPIYLNGGVAYGYFTNLSDKRLKNNIVPLTGSLDKVLKLQGVSFDWKSDGRKDIGLIAQDVEKVYPEAVSTDSKGIKGIEYGNLVAPLVEAIKEQQKEISDLKAEVESLKAAR